jgi:nucleoside-diphosphate-sugar epimerase
MNKTALVTGATGFIGSYLFRFLRSKGWKVIGSYSVSYSLDAALRREDHLWQHCKVSQTYWLETYLVTWANPDLDVGILGAGNIVSRLVGHLALQLEEA